MHAHHDDDRVLFGRLVRTSVNFCAAKIYLKGLDVLDVHQHFGVLRLHKKHMDFFVVGKLTQVEALPYAPQLTRLVLTRADTSTEMFVRGSPTPDQWRELESCKSFEAVMTLAHTIEKEFTGCAYCLSVQGEKRQCLGCQHVRYCGSECQKKHWVQEHSKVCKKIW